MGQVWAKTYFPQGFEAWLTKVINNEDREEALAWANEHKPHVPAIIEAYRELEKEVREMGAVAWMEKAKAIANGRERKRQWKKARKEAGLPTKSDPDADAETRNAFEKEKEAAIAAMDKCDAYNCTDQEALRMLYDTLVANKICDTWAKMIELPAAEAKSHYQSRYPGGRVESLFHEVHKEHSLPEGPDPIIWYYNHYCC